MAKMYPVIGEWYQEAAEDLFFEVVAVDEAGGTVEVQLIGGEITELDFDTWNQMILLPAEAPEDWRASYTLSREDRHGLDDVYIPDNYQDPLGSIEPDGLDEYY
ncbi:hypothetical protein QP938_07340 [Porticoccaceae bacterium LTM1]|nr:hypothetical protein QP938_07340 [Porticoccaceae bacterium LTM1]